MRTPFLALLLSCLGLGSASLSASEILWSQYCQHLGKMKLLVHLDTDPTAEVEEEPEPVELWLREGDDDGWERAATQPVDRLTP